MTRPALISQADLKRMAAVANSEGVTVELEREGVIVRVMPFHPPQVSTEESGEAELARWIANNEARKQREAQAAAVPPVKTQRAVRARIADPARAEMSEADRIRERLAVESFSARKQPHRRKKPQ